MELRAPFKWFIQYIEQLHPVQRYYRPFFISHGYAMVNTDVRGSGASFGVWRMPWEEASVEDAKTILDWIIAQPWSNGNVAGYGLSYMGTTAELLLASGHPALKAVLPAFNHPDVFVDAALPGGIFNQRFIKEWGRLIYTLDQNQKPDNFSTLLRILVQGVRPVDSDRGHSLLHQAISEHQHNSHFDMIEGVNFRDEIDPDLNHDLDDVTVSRYMDKIRANPVPSYGWASWLDAGTADAALRRFMTFPQAKRVVIGAWEHGGGRQCSPYQSPGAPVRPHFSVQWQEQLRFYDAYLKNVNNGIPGERVIYYYTLGSETWQKTDTWPPGGVKYERWYFAPDRLLSPLMPAGKEGSDGYSVDFSATTGKNNRWWSLGPAYNQPLSYPDREAQSEKLLTYTSLPLEEDLEVSGYPIIHLHVRSSEPDVAFFIYLEDVHPQGKVFYLTEGILRSIHRKISSQPSPYQLQVPYHSFRRDDAQPLIPGEIAEVSFGLYPISALIRRGHCLRVSIAGADADTFPRIPAHGFPELEFFHNRHQPSAIDLPVRRKN
jgi:putative CocE/NonD family hydrolase